MSEKEDDEPVTKRGRRSSTKRITKKDLATSGRYQERSREAGGSGVGSGAGEGDGLAIKRGKPPTTNKTPKKGVPEGTSSAKENKKGSQNAKESAPEPDPEEDDEPVSKRGRLPATKTPRKKALKTSIAVGIKKLDGKDKAVKAEEQDKELEFNSGADAEDEPVVKAKKVSAIAGALSFTTKKVKSIKIGELEKEDKSAAEEEDMVGSDDDMKPAIAEKAREAVAKALSGNKLSHPYPDWPAGASTPYGALVKTLTLVEGTTKRLEKLSHASLLLRQVLRLTPDDLLTVIHLMTNKLAADYEGLELGIGESLLMKAIGESCGRSMDKIREDQKEIGDLGMVAMKSRNNQGTLFKPKPLTIKSVHQGLLDIATVKGEGGQGRKVAGIKKLLAAAKGDEAKYLVRGLEGKLRTGLAENTIIVALSQAQIVHEMEAKGKKASVEMLTEAELKLRSVFRYVKVFSP